MLANVCLRQKSANFPDESNDILIQKMAVAFFHLPFYFGGNENLF